MGPLLQEELLRAYLASMNKFLATLDRLSSGFADDVVTAVRKTPADELYRVLGKTPPAPPSAPVVVKRTAAPAPKKAAPVAKKEVAPKAPKAPKPAKKAPAPAAKKEVAPKKEVAVKAAPAPKKEPVAPKKAAPATGPLGAAAIVSVRRFFEECGRRGATAQQVQRHLEHDESDARVPALLRELTHEGVIRDAGFRRTTGNGTQPVLVIA